MIVSKRALAVLALVAVPSLAHAQSEDTALAQTLFDEGLKLMDEGKFAVACPKLAESQRLDPGGGTLINLALCREREGKLASAWAAYNDALSTSIRDGRKERENAAREHLALITPKLAKLTISVSNASTPGLEVRFDNAPVRQAAWGVATPADVGKHEISASAPGKVPWKTSVEIVSDGQSRSIEVPALADAAVKPDDTTATTNTTTINNPPATEPVQPGSKDNTAAWIVGGVGVAGVVVGAITGIVVLSKKSSSDAACPNRPACTTQAGVDDMKSAQTMAWVSDISFGVGIVGLAVSTVLFLTAKPKAASSPSTATILPTFGLGTAGVQGRF